MTLKSKLTRFFFRGNFPAQFWLLFWGMIISATGSSMIWPFLMVYVSGKLQMPLAAVASLLTINAICGLAASFIAGPIIDRLGRKWVMVISLACNALYFIFLREAVTYPAFAVLLGIGGMVNPLYRIGTDAMMADLIPPEQRQEAYSIMRTANNVGVAIGPAVGGFIASVSYGIAFYIAAGGMSIYALLILIFAVETLAKPAVSPVGRPVERFGGYVRIFRDTPFILFCAAFVFTSISASIMWIMLSVYAKNNFGIAERMYGWIPTTNAIMVVAFQMIITRWTRSRPILGMMALGALFYAIGVSSVALGNGYWWFWGSMVIMTIGELIVSPTGTTFVANLAPADMRGRYMSIYGLTWNVAAGIGPVIGGMLNDNLGPVWIWIGGGVAGLLSAFVFWLMQRKIKTKASAT